MFVRNTLISSFEFEFARATISRNDSSHRDFSIRIAVLINGPGTQEHVATSVAIAPDVLGYSNGKRDANRRLKIVQFRYVSIGERSRSARLASGVPYVISPRVCPLENDVALENASR